MQFKFTNVSNGITESDVAKVLTPPPHKTISPELKIQPIRFLEPYYRDNIPGTNNLNGMLVKLPIYGGSYITLEPQEVIILEVEKPEEILFYSEIAEAFSDAKYYPVITCEKDEPGPTPPQPVIDQFTINTTDGSLHHSSYYAFGGIDHSINLVEGEVWGVELTIDGETQSIPDITAVKFSEVHSDAGALANNLCLDSDFLGTIIDKAETKFTDKDLYAPIYNASKTTWEIVCIEDGHIVPAMIKFTRKSEN